MMCGLAISLSSPAFAQDAETETQPQAGPVEAADPSVSSDADPAADGEGDIVVTGSRIPQPNLTSVSPVTVVNSQEVKLTGTTRTEDLLNALPQVFAGQGGNLANGASGTATLDLRGLGPQRTLVLINGRRLHSGDPNSNNIVSPDINIIPAAMIDRVDVLTGGASSVYGSDAVAGVVNFVMDTDFEGIRFDGQYSFYNHDNNSTLLRDGPNGLIDRNFGYPGGTVADGGAVDLNLVIGAGFDDGHGHVVAYAGYRKIDAVTQDKRDYSACASQARTAAQIAAGNLPPLFCGGSPTSANGTIFTNTQTLQIGPNRTLIPNFTPYNFAPTNYYQRPDERYTAGFFANYEISRSLRPYMEFMFMDDRTLAQIAPSGNFGNTYSINCDNPLLSAQQRAILCAPANLVTEVNPLGFPLVDPNGTGDPPLIFTDPTTGRTYTRGFAQILKRNVEGGARIDDLRHTHYRAVVGMRGDLGNAWSYDASYQYGTVLLSENFKNDVSISRLTNALDVVDDPRTAAIDPVCRVFVTGQDVNCVPYDIFQLNGVSQAAINYVSIPAFLSGTIKQSILTGSLTGDLGSYGVQFPWAESAVGIALGVEYRKESLDLQTDAAYQAGDLSGQGGASLPVSGAFDVREAFAEARIPIVESSFFHDLSLELGYRYSDYKLKTQGGGGYSTDAYKIGVNFAPIRDVRFRGGYNRAVRAPNIQELFAPRRVALNGAGDPCAGATPTASLAACQAMDVTAAQYGNIAGNPAGQYNGLIGGTATLIPETATTKTLGVVLQPSFLPRFALTVDWFDIKIDDTIGQIGQDATLAACVATLDPDFCGAVVRDSTGSLWRTPNGYVVDVYTNAGGTRTRGVDLGASYNLELGSLGGLGFQFVGTWLDKLLINDGINPVYDCAGLYGATCLVPSPEWRHRFRVTYTTPDGIGISANWRHIKSVEVDRSSSAQALSGAFAPANARLPSVNYLDLALTARVGDHYQFRLGVNNILDKDPPIFGANGVNVVINACPAVLCSGNTFPQVYDAMGRYIFAGVTLDF